MKTATTILCVVLPLLASAEMCNVFNNDGPVHCRSSPKFSAKSVTTIGDGDAWDFSCYKTGDCYEGVCSWDYNWELKCYINGFYTSDQCNSSNVTSSLIICNSVTDDL
ncbi:hypothetical protein THAR02_09580 [Trichoderma harzianum]|uniref:Uncharacterized protein n=1 Tax=Trichoderma harzianum TaxID=5544 RepID=A0A0F9ZCY3_TRIHA|nr:hypothetical protein THAR02_09580 [Trichoderma harzianum]